MAKKRKSVKKKTSRRAPRRRSVPRAEETPYEPRIIQHPSAAVPEVRSTTESLIEQSHEGERLLHERAEGFLGDCQKAFDVAGADLENAQSEVKRCEGNHTETEAVLNRARDYVRQFKQLGSQPTANTALPCPEPKAR